MKTLAATSVLSALLCGVTFAQVHRQKEPVDYVSPNIGMIGQLLTATLPYVQRPHGMARLAPITAMLPPYSTTYDPTLVPQINKAMAKSGIAGGNGYYYPPQDPVQP